MSETSASGLRRFRRYVPEPFQPVVRRAYLRLGPATSAFRMEPAFLVVGGQRCGTTTIFKSLSEHPQIMRPPVEKGTDYYTLYYDRGREWYRGHFATRAAGHFHSGRGAPAVAFEACTYYMFHPFAMERIARDYPEIKLVAMLRDPVERAYSAYKHEIARGFETETDFLKALELESTRLEGEVEKMAADPAYESLAHRHHAYTRRGQYAEQLERIFRYFSEEQVYVMESESFFRDPVREFGGLVNFLGLRSWAPKQISQHNARPSEPMPKLAREYLTQYYQPYDDALADLLSRQPGWRVAR